MSTRSKGRNAEKECAKILRDQKYLVDLVRGSTRFGGAVDFFGVGDVLAINKTEFLIVQVKCNATAGAPKKLKQFRIDNELPDWVKLQVWVRHDNKSVDKRWRIIEC